jgi:importin subunit alpha-6/7
VTRREACWVLSNIAAGSKAQVETLLKMDSLIKKAVELFQSDSEEVKREICHIFANIGHNGDESAVFNLLKDNQLMPIYIDMLSSSDNKAVIASLDCLKVILSQGEKQKAIPENPFVHELITIGAIDKI